MPLPYKKTGTEQRLAPTAFKKFMYESTKLKFSLLTNYNALVVLCNC